MNALPHVVSKIMSATAEEFVQSLGVLLGRAVSIDELPICIAVGSGQVEIAREPLQGVRLGGLLELPRARVSLSYSAVPAAKRADFQRRFDLAFQRGGG